MGDEHLRLLLEQSRDRERRNILLDASNDCSVFALMKKVDAPTGSRMRLLTFGPPCRIETSRPYLR